MGKIVFIFTGEYVNSLTEEQKTKLSETIKVTLDITTKIADVGADILKIVLEYPIVHLNITKRIFPSSNQQTIHQ